MTRDDWFAGTNPHVLLQAVRDRASARQLRLFCGAVCQRVVPYLPDERSRRALRVAGLFIDGQATGRHLARARQFALRAAEQVRQQREQAQAAQRHLEQQWPLPGAWWDSAEALARHDDREAAAWLVWRWLHEMALDHAASPTGAAAKAEAPRSRRGLSPAAMTEVMAEQVTKIVTEEGQEAPERARQCALIRCIFGSACRPVTVSPGWLGSTVRALARTIDDERAFDRLPILADALEEAGCADADVLLHCRQPGEHVRGCWVIDLLVGKK